MALRQQSAIEFLSTYAFAIFIISLVLVAAFTISVSVGSTAPVYSSCNLQPLLICQQSLLTYNSVTKAFNYIIVLRNDLGFSLQFPSANAINLTVLKLSGGNGGFNLGKCSPLFVGQGSQAICQVAVTGQPQSKQGATSYAQFSLFYQLCTGLNSSTCGNTIYSATGTSYQSLSQGVTNLYNVIVTSSNGVMIINQEPYFNNTAVYLTSGSYTVYAQPSSGFNYISTSWSGGSLGVCTPPATGCNTISVSSNGNLIAIFTH